MTGVPDVNVWFKLNNFRHNYLLNHWQCYDRLNMEEAKKIKHWNRIFTPESENEDVKKIKVQFI